MTEGILKLKEEGRGRERQWAKNKTGAWKNLGLYSKGKLIWKNENCSEKIEPSNNNKAISPH